MKNLIAAVLLLCSGLAQAETVTIDFEEFDPYGFEEGPVNSQGFIFDGGPRASVTWHNDSSADLSFAASTESDYYSSHLGFQHESSQPFSLQSMDLEVYGDEQAWILGYRADGTEIQLEINTLSEVWNSLVFTEEWTNLTSINISGYFGTSLEIDNIVVTTVPIPAAVWLFASALAGLGWMRRKQTT